LWLLNLLVELHGSGARVLVQTCVRRYARCSHRCAIDARRNGTARLSALATCNFGLLILCLLWHHRAGDRVMKFTKKKGVETRLRLLYFDNMVRTRFLFIVFSVVDIDFPTVCPPVLCIPRHPGLVCCPSHDLP
jgi:hypothetical protein